MSSVFAGKIAEIINVKLSKHKFFFAISFFCKVLIIKVKKKKTEVSIMIDDIQIVDVQLTNYCCWTTIFLVLFVAKK